MGTVWLVYEGDYDSRHVAAVYTTELEARRHEADVQDLEEVEVVEYNVTTAYAPTAEEAAHMGR